MEVLCEWRCCLAETLVQSKGFEDDAVFASFSTWFRGEDEEPCFDSGPTFVRVMETALKTRNRHVAVRNQTPKKDFYSQALFRLRQGNKALVRIPRIVLLRLRASKCLLTTKFDNWLRDKHESLIFIRKQVTKNNDRLLFFHVMAWFSFWKCNCCNCFERTYSGK